MSPKKQSYENLAETLIKKLNMRGMEGYYCSTKEEVMPMINRLLTPGASIAWGGSESLKEVGFFDELEGSDYVVLDRNLVKTPEEEREFAGKVATCDYFFMSSNAITLDGELVNIDGRGNRVAYLIYGPQNVIVVAGMNKIVADVDSGIKRTQNVAAPPNGVRLNTETPCATLGRCGNCLQEKCMCCEIVITRKSRIPNRIKVILVGEELGF